MPPDTIELVTPPGRPWDPVVRLVLGGIGDRLDLGFEQLDDLQLAVERLLAEYAADHDVRLRFELGDGSVRTDIGPFAPTAVAEGLRTASAPGGELTLRRIIETTVDSLEVREEPDGRLIVRLEKVVGGN